MHILRGRNLAVFFASIGIMVMLNFVYAPRAHAEQFGGLRLFNFTCNCSANQLVFVYDYKTMAPLQLIYQPGASRIYSQYNILAAKYLLGTYTPGGAQCQIYAGTSCVNVGAPSGIMDSVPGTGTSV